MNNLPPIRAAKTLQKDEPNKNDVAQLRLISASNNGTLLPSPSNASLSSVSSQSSQHSHSSVSSSAHRLLEARHESHARQLQLMHEQRHTQSVLPVVRQPSSSSPIPWSRKQRKPYDTSIASAAWNIAKPPASQVKYRRHNHKGRARVDHRELGTSHTDPEELKSSA